MSQEAFCTSWKYKTKLNLTDSSHSRVVAMLFHINFVGNILESFSSKDCQLINLTAGVLNTLLLTLIKNKCYSRLNYIKIVKGSSFKFKHIQILSW